MPKKLRIETVANTAGFSTTIANTRLSQRETLEETITNLAALVGAKRVQKIQSQRGSFFYSVDERTYQSASNTILDLSRKALALAK